MVETPAEVTFFTTTTTLAAPVERIWALVSDFAAIMAWHPSITRCETDGTHIGALRTLELNGREVVERLDECNAESHLVQYSIVVGRPEAVGVTGRITLERVTDEETSVAWQTTVPNRPGADDLESELREYYVGRMENLRDAVELRAPLNQG